MTSIKELSDRLDKQAAAIKALRTRVRVLEGGGEVSQSNGASPSTVQHGAVGTYTPSPLCLACGADKRGRVELTCRPCGQARQAAINGETARPSYDQCGSCGAGKTPSMTLLCRSCSVSYKAWKGAQS